MFEITKRSLSSGNYFHDSKGEIVEIVEFEWDKHWATVKYLDGTHAETNIDCLTPIKLTPEILEKAGFEFLEKEGFEFLGKAGIKHLKKDDFTSVYRHDDVEKTTFTLNYDSTLTLEFWQEHTDSVTYMPKDLTFLHDFQAFYSIWNRKELEIKF